MKKTARHTVIALAGAAALTLVAPGVASAETVSGWIGPASAGGVNYLHQSSITTSPYSYAHTAVWTPFGNPIALNAVGINARLFKGSVLCDATDYIYNGYSTINFSIGTSSPDCRPGSYNSHGLARIANGNGGYNSIVTFPTSPVTISDGQARSLGEVPDEVVTPSVTADGRTTGSALGIEDVADLPDLVAAYGDSGEIGYVKSADLQSPELTPDEVAALPTSNRSESVVATTAARSVPLYDVDGSTVIGSFEIG